MKTDTDRYWWGFTYTVKDLTVDAVVSVCRAITGRADRARAWRVMDDGAIVFYEDSYRIDLKQAVAEALEDKHARAIDKALAKAGVKS